MSGAVLFWVQHLLGSGHLRRIAAVAHALDARGVAATVASGGPPLTHLACGGARLVQLAPVRAADEGFRGLVTAAGAPVDKHVWRERAAVLAGLVERLEPAVVVTETYPFGRRQLRAEVRGLLDAAMSLARRPVVVASVRDILQRQTKQERIAEMLEIAQRHYDHVLVHGDPALVTLEESLPAAAAIADRLHHTGYIATGDEGGAAPDPDAGRDEVVVSAGGGLVGGRLLETAAAARALSRLAGARTWRLLAGDAGHAGAVAAAARLAGPGVAVEANRADFRTLLANCAVSVSQAGYNTATDLFQTGARAVLVPYVGEGETEQADRARRLAERGLAVVVEEHALDPARLAAAVDAALAAPAPDRRAIDLDGAATSARLLARWSGHG